MERFLALTIMFVMSLSSILVALAVFARSPIFCTLTLALMYTLYLFLANEKAGVHNAQEFENRFWVSAVTTRKRVYAPYLARQPASPRLPAAGSGPV